MAAEESAETALTEKRYEFMINFNFTNEIPNLRNAHFIKPRLSVLSPLPKPPKIESLSLYCKPKVNFRGNPSPLQSWTSWVKQLESKYEPVWRKAGIFDALKCSTYHIEEHKDLLLSLAEKWCPESNTFVFPWGEASITVEDVMVLGGFSPLGDSVMSGCCLGGVVEDIEYRLINWRNEVGVGSCSESDVIQGTWTQWCEYLMGRGDELEHAAFLVLWLSRYVFITKASAVIRPFVFSIAARLSCGIKVALAPAVLAIIYRELRLLKERLVHCSGSLFDDQVLFLVAPFHLVQLWAWERFPRLAPVPRMLNVDEPRLARWEDVKTCYMGLNMEWDSAGETFRWRPYATFVDNWLFLSYYDDVGKWVSVGSDEKWEMFGVCLRVCQLHGVDFEDAENYNPHRVAKQFGFDQDIPCSFPSSSNETSSTNLNPLITVTKLYVPSRFFQGQVTLRYAHWWKGKCSLDENDSLHDCNKRKLRSRTLSLPVLCPQSTPPVECQMLKNKDLGKKMRRQDYPSQPCNEAMEVDSVSIKEIPKTDLATENLASQSHVSLVPEGAAENGKLSEHAPVTHEKGNCVVNDAVIVDIENTNIRTPSSSSTPHNTPICTGLNRSTGGIGEEHPHEACDDGVVTMIDIDETGDDEIDNPLDALCKKFEERISLLETTVPIFIWQLNPDPNKLGTL